MVPNSFPFMGTLARATVQHKKRHFQDVIKVVRYLHNNWVVMVRSSSLLHRLRLVPGDSDWSQNCPQQVNDCELDQKPVTERHPGIAASHERYCMRGVGCSMVVSNFTGSNYSSMPNPTTNEAGATGTRRRRLCCLVLAPGKPKGPRSVLIREGRGWFISIGVEAAGYPSRLHRPKLQYL